MLAIGHFVWEYEGVSREWRTELYVMLCIVVGHFMWECEGVNRVWHTELCVLLCVGSWTFCAGV